MDARTGEFVPVIGETMSVGEIVYILGHCFKIEAINSSRLTLRSKAEVSLDKRLSPSDEVIIKSISFKVESNVGPVLVLRSKRAIEAEDFFRKLTE